LRRGVIRLGDQIKDIWFRDITSKIPPVSSASYIVYTDGSKYYAKNGDIGMIEFVDTDISNLLQNVINVLYQRYGGGRIFIKRGMYYPTKTINILDGMSLIIEGEGNNTVFRYTNGFNLFHHEPSNPTWATMVILRNFKVDRSGSGNNHTDILRVSYAKLAVFENIEIVDDLRTVPSYDAGICGFNNLVAVAVRNRVYNKDYAFWLFGYLAVLRENHVENTYLEGISGGGLIKTYFLPSGYDAGGIAIIEDNVCVDCGQGEVAISVDFLNINPLADALAIIRNNLVYGRTQPFIGAIDVVQASHAIVENNKIMGIAKGGAISFANAYQVKYAVVRNNVVDLQYLTFFYYPEINVNAEQAIVEGNRINVNSTANDNIRVFAVIANHAVIRGNKIYASVPSNLYTIPVSIFPFDTSIFDVVFEDNYIDIPSPSWDAPLGIYFDKQSRLVNIVIQKNYFRSPNGGDAILIDGVAQQNFVVHKVVVYNNVVDNLSNNVKVRHDKSGYTITAYVDGDVDLYYYSGGSAYYYKRNSGSATFSGDGSTTQFKIAHGLRSAPSKVLVTPASADARGSYHVTADATYIYVNYATAPPAGTNNIVLYWYAEV